MIKFKKHAYFFPIILLCSVLAGGVVGSKMGEKVYILKPIADIFLNLMMVAIVPFIFFSVASSVEQIIKNKQLGKLFVSMAGVFLFTGIIAALFMFLVVDCFPPAWGNPIMLPISGTVTHVALQEQLVSIFTVNDFTQLFSHHSLLPLIIFAILVGSVTAKMEFKINYFSVGLRQGSDIFLKLISMIMTIAPLGFFAFFTVLIHDIGSTFLSTYLRVGIIYYGAALFYLLIIYSLYVFLMSGRNGVKQFWTHVYLPAFTALVTCSSALSLPVSMQAIKKMGVPALIVESVLPLGTFLHKEGSILGGITKIAFLFGLFHLSFSGVSVILFAICVSCLVGSVMGAIPGGGMLGELLILSLYGFPKEAFLVIVVISILIDPIASVINVVGNNVCCLLISKLMKKETGTDDMPAFIVSEDSISH